MIHFFHTHISPRALELAAETLRSTFISEGKVVAQFESALGRQLGLSHPVALNSGTSALHLALAVAGVKAGDEVILPAQTFVATGQVILMQAAKPVFADIQPSTGNIDPASVRAKITDRTKALMPVHWGGYPCDLEELNQVAAEFKLAVIEDAAHALGATYKDKPVGSISRFTAFSFQAIKHLTTGDGGCLCCAGADDFEDARIRRWFGIDRLKSRPSLLGERVYDIDRIGYKYHMNDLAAALGLGNLEDLPRQLARRREIAARYRGAFQTVPGLALLDNAADRQSAYWLFTLLVERREDCIRALHDRGVPSSVVHQRIDRNSIFGGCRPDLPGQEYFDAHQLAVPLHGGLQDDDVEVIIQAVRAGW